MRERAWDFYIPEEMKWNEGMSQSQFREEIMTERVRELFGERWRKFDLIRTGHFLEYVSERNKWTKKSGTIQAYNVVWPIPPTELQQNDDMIVDGEDDQNDGYR